MAVASGAFGPASLLAALARIADRIGPTRLRILATEFGQAPICRDADASDEELVAAIPRLSEHFDLRPDWRAPDLKWLLTHAQNKSRYGEMQRRVVFSPGDSSTVVGCYFYHGRPGAVARVLQVLALPAFVGSTMDCLFRHAAKMGCVGVRGRLESDFFNALVERRCLMLHVAATMVSARDRGLLDKVLRSRSLLTGLGGEMGMELIGGDFSQPEKRRTAKSTTEWPESDRQCQSAGSLEKHD